MESSSEENDKNIFTLDSKELATYLTRVQEMYTRGESRENVFRYFLNSMTSLIQCKYGFIAELVEDTNLGKIFKSVVVNSEEEQEYSGNFSISIDHPLFDDITKHKHFIIKKNVLDASIFGWPQSTNSLCIIPFFEKEDITGVIALSYDSEEEPDISRILPMKFICASLLKGFKTNSLKEIYEGIVNCMSIPILVFTKDPINLWITGEGKKKPTKYHSMTQINANDLTLFNCIVCNDAFRQLKNNDDIFYSNEFYSGENGFDKNSEIQYFSSSVPKLSVNGIFLNQNKDETKRKTFNDDEPKMIGKFFYDCFPNMIDNQQIQMRWLDMWKTGNKTTIDAMSYYDINIKQDLYSLEFNKLDQRTFIMILCPVSEQLRAKELIHSLAKTQEEFVGKISHELRTPVNAILSILSLLYDSPFAKQLGETGNDFRDKLQMMSESSVTLCSLIQDVLDYTQLESKSLNISYKTFDLVECVDNAISMISTEAERKGLTLTRTITADVPLCIVSDPKRLKQILVNLLSNAVKFTVHGGIHIKISTNPYRIANNVSTIVFAIEDTGIGISEQDKPKLFKPFSQIYTDEGGTGLGLIISKHIANLLGGEIWVDSVLNRGSVFSFNIKARACSLDSIKEYYGPILKNKTVLVVDPDQKSRNVLIAFLLDQEVHTTSTENVDIAITYLKSKLYHFDLVITDINHREEISKYHDNIITVMNCSGDIHHLPPIKIVNNVNPVDLFETYRGPFKPKSDMLPQLSQLPQQIPHLSLNNKNKIKKPSDDNISKSHRTICRPIDKVNLIQLCYSSLAKCPSGGANIFKFQTTETKKVPIVRDLNILVVEDDYINRKVLHDILIKLGYSKITQTENGQEALNVIKKGSSSFDVILLDLKMPILNGYQLFEALLDMHRTNKIKKIPYTIALTASAMNSDKQRCLQMGMNQYMAKPIDIAALKALLSSFTIVN